MENSIEYSPKGVCSVKMVVSEKNGIITDVKIIGGCPGNSVGVSKLCVGMKLEDAIEKLSKIKK